MSQKIIKVYEKPPITPEEIAEFRDKYGTGAQQMLAEKYGVSRQMIYNWEHPDRDRPARRRFVCRHCGGKWSARRLTDPARCKYCKSADWGEKSDFKGRYSYHADEHHVDDSEIVIKARKINAI